MVIAEHPVLERSALGRSGFLGAFYDARTDTFCHGSLFNTTRLPESSIVRNDINFLHTEYSYEDSYSKRFEKLDINGDFKLSVLAGLIPISGSGKYIKDDRASSKTIKGVLIYNIKTVEEKITAYDEELRPYLSLDTLQQTGATHFVGGIVWGANTFASFEYQNVDDSKNQEVKASIEGQMQRFSVDLTGSGNLQYDNNDQNSSNSFKLKVYGDVIPEGEELPQTVDAALELMKKTPQYINRVNGGKGKPIFFTLYPVAEVLKFFKSTINVNTAVKELNEHLIIKVEQLFDNLLCAKQELHSLVEEVKKPSASFFARQTVDKVVKFEQELSVAEADLKRGVREALIGIRSNSVGEVVLENVLKDFLASKFSPNRVSLFVIEQSPIPQKRQWCEGLLMKGVQYSMRGQGQSLESLLLHESELYVFGFCDFEASKHTDLWKKNYQLLLELLSETKQNNSMTNNTTRFLISEEETNGPFNEPTVCHYSKGQLVSSDLLSEREAEKSLCFIKYNADPQLPDGKPNNRAAVDIRCPGSLYGRCNPAIRNWLCERCHSHIEYCYDSFYYCPCGKVNVKYCSYKCCDEKHGNNYRAFQADDDLRKMLKMMKPKKELNILILGETGVGKSTFINAFANYLTFEKLEDAETEELISLIPTSFTVTDENYEERKISFGADDNEADEEGESCTQTCRAYLFPFGDKIVRLIDTPGMGDTRGIDQDKKNFANILAFISHYSGIHGICVLLKPNNAKLTVVFRFCIKELLCHLHRSASENIVFLFTNARSTFYRPGDTLPPLRKMLQEVKSRPPNVNITLNQNTIYCLDNEAFRFLVALKSQVGFTEEEKGNFSSSWTRSVNECLRMIGHILQLKPHKVKETVSLNEARNLIVGLSRPIGDITQNIQRNLVMLEEQEVKIRLAGDDITKLQDVLHIPAIDLEPVHFDQPRTVCASPSCYKIYSIDDKKKIDYVKICHNPCYLENIEPNLINNTDLKGCKSMDYWGNCKVCGCGWAKHMHIYYENKQIETKVVDRQVENEIGLKLKGKEAVAAIVTKLENRKAQLEVEQKIITETSAKFAYFLKHNAITPYNDALKGYLEHLIAVEEDKVEMDPEKKQLVDELRKMKYSYDAEVFILEQNMAQATGGPLTVNAGTILDCAKELYALPINGPTIQKMVIELEEAKDQACKRFTETYYDFHIPRYNPNQMKTKKKKNWVTRKIEEWILI